MNCWVVPTFCQQTSCEPQCVPWRSFISFSYDGIRLTYGCCVCADDDELLDDADLLSADELRAAPPAAAGDDCEVGKAGRKACKNCTCGRADAEAAGVKVALTQARMGAWSVLGLRGVEWIVFLNILVFLGLMTLGCGRAGAGAASVAVAAGAGTTAGDACMRVARGTIWLEKGAALHG